MAPNPYIASGRMVFSAVVPAVTHEMHYACAIVADALIPSGYALLGNDVGVTHIDPQDAADQWWGIVKAFYSNAVTGATWQLESRTGDVFVPVAAGACAGGAGTGGTATLTSVVTTTFSDDQNFGVKFTFPETSFPLPYHTSLVADLTALGDFASSVLGRDATTPDVGAWARSRSSNTIELARFGNNTLSRRLRRLRGYL